MPRCAAAQQVLKKGSPMVGHGAAGPLGQTGARTLSDGADVVRLRALGSLGGGVFHLLVFIQGAVAVRVDGRVVNEDVGTAAWGDEAISLVRVEPLHGLCAILLSPSDENKAPHGRAEPAPARH